MSSRSLGRLFGRGHRQASARVRNPALLASSLEKVASNVMIADANFNIVYMNEQVSAFLKDAENEIRQVIPSFDASSLLGRSIDTFHRNPAHQREVLTRLSGTHRATISVGSRKFDLTANPLTDRSGQRIGTVVEWADADLRLAAEDYSAQIEALGRSQAIIEFKPDGTILKANDLFLAVMGYSREEILGEHHSMFVDPEFASSAEYARFWEALRHGDLHTAEFRRLGKGAREVWIQGLYAPATNEKGEIFKVVKFAVDITQLVQRRQEAERIGKLVDESLEQIVDVVARANERSAGAAGAATETSATVQAVASAAAEFDASTQEIARSMTLSRAAVEKAMTETEAVTQSTSALADAAEAMNGVVEIIQAIAGRINLLALNATIESARAGESGKGFAVVATEVKNLANQVASAIGRIGDEISNVQAVSGEVVSRVQQIQKDVASVHESVAVVATAIEEQTSTSQEITSNMQTAASAVGEISASLTDISAAIETTDSHAHQGMELYRSLNRSVA